MTSSDYDEEAATAAPDAAAGVVETLPDAAAGALGRAALVAPEEPRVHGAYTSARSASKTDFPRCFQSETVSHALAIL